jgi:hypothetical protein
MKLILTLLACAVLLMFVAPVVLVGLAVAGCLFWLFLLPFRVGAAVVGAVFTVIATVVLLPFKVLFALI